MNWEILKHLNNIKTPETQVEFNSLFTKLAQEIKPTSMEELKKDISIIFDKEYDTQFNNWEKNLFLDRRSLKEIFYGN